MAKCGDSDPECGEKYICRGWGGGISTSGFGIWGPGAQAEWGGGPHVGGVTYSRRALAGRPCGAEPVQHRVATEWQEKGFCTGEGITVKMGDWFQKRGFF